MLRKSALLTVAVSIALIQILVAGVIQSAYSFYPMPPIEVSLNIDRSSAKGFEDVRPLSPQNIDTPEFVLKRGNTGTINMTLSSKDNETVHVTLSYEGSARDNYRSWSEEENIPDGITYSIEPSSNITLAPNSSVVETLRISASKDTAIRNYNLTLYLILVKGDRDEGHGYSTSLTIIDNASSSTTNTTTSIAKITAPYIIQTTTLTSTTTTTVATRLTEGATASLVYAWAVGTTTIAVALAAVILLRSRRRGQGY